MRQLLGTALLMGVAVVAHAGHGDLGYYVNPNVGFVFGDDERGPDDAVSFGVGLGRPWSDRQNIELDLKFNDFDEGETYALTLGLLTYLGEGHSRVFSIFRAGITISEGHPNDDYEALNLGGGIGYRYPLLGFGDLRVEATLNADIHSNEESSRFGEKLFFLEPAITIGYQIPLGARAENQRTRSDVTVVEASLDSDNDGVPDSADLCPQTPAGTKVDSTGCAPATAPVVRSDCPTPVAGQAVDSRGCAVADSTLLAAVVFEFDSAELTTKARGDLSDLAVQLKGTTGRIEVAGHASDEGDEFYNLDLSQRRASTVRRYLIDEGVDPSRIISRGYGDGAPRTENKSAAGRRDNRRVEVRSVR